MKNAVDIQVVPIGADQIDALRLSLERAGLPTADLVLPARRFFRFDYEGVPLGYGGLEGQGQDVLLRSLVIESEKRGQGWGAAVLEQMEAMAATFGAIKLHLLTNTAANFFKAHGYSECPRALAPDHINQSEQFKSLCPSTATYLAKTIA
ncbi:MULTISPECIES: arsenic resistance N-acetyltransferase ArsN2 [Pseudomonas]|jgi:amino-acid N-acetyltransferase|uniref:arsenic resistance N-acetyltransferase ArsN2 n=1 Tax=Pseudomonas TaxID=286 RepID=UPI000B84B0D5|nr:MULTISPECIES: arsenic resistance N-acetyltransferase ArsN2 [Pseudomonas]MCP1482816.1 amino-acid N-acetyltransferase [Pseudomonas chlororaphis]MCP1596827.1 amino-acid N-acetyltransferase [Pseudomonas chlororaphis]WDH52413.1 arsenic resistance N-acetyltransferase ArsN2 [Pseudomonas chlororaphis]WPO46560.1 arsenic resistance N-acetyltransferase ArsN2 [Pseudomonas sp. S1Bt23]